MTTRNPSPPHIPQGGELPLAELAAESLKLIGDFEALLRDETRALDATDFDTAEVLQNRKIRMAERYHDLTRELRARKEDLKKHHPELREKLTAARDSFSEAARDNINAIERRRFSSQRLVDRLIEGARRGLQKSSTYGKGGQRLDQAPGKVSFGLNQTL